MEENKSNITDYSGHENLEIMSETMQFNNWMYNEILPAIKGNILEVGSGLGTFSEKIIGDFPNSHITLTDVDPSYVQRLEKKFSNRCIPVFKLDLNEKEDYEKIGYDKFDSIIALNVLEHVKNDEFALLQLYKMLKNGGMLVLLVPSHKFLFNTIDKKVGHFRRYSRKDLESKIKKTRFVVDKTFYFNMVGIIGWYVNGNLARASTINLTASRIFDKIVPISKLADRITGKKIGLSLICFLKK